MAIANGINKLTVFKVQTGLGVPATGSGGQVVRREQSKFDLEIGSFTNNEITEHQQSTGVTNGSRKVNGSLNGVLSPNTYSKFMAAAMRKAFAATTPLTAAAVTIAGTAPNWTVAISAGSFLTAGFKIGDVIRLSVGTLGALNINKNLFITGLTATVATVTVVNGSLLTAEGPIAGCTLTVTGKKCIVPVTGHSREYWTVEEWAADIAQSELSTDVMIGGFDIGLSNNANATFAMTAMGLNQTASATQQLTTPIATTNTDVINALSGIITVNGVVQAAITGASIKLDGKTAPIEAAISANGMSPDHSRGVITVSGQFTAYFENGVLPALFNAGTVVSLTVLAVVDTTAASEFIVFNIPAISLTGASKDDGEKGIIRTYPFTAEINQTGGAALSKDRTILSIQDSLAA
jgi:hypothetical protein